MTGTSPLSEPRLHQALGGGGGGLRRLAVPNPEAEAAQHTHAHRSVTAIAQQPLCPCPCQHGGRRWGQWSCVLWQGTCSHASENQTNGERESCPCAPGPLLALGSRSLARSLTGWKKAGPPSKKGYGSRGAFCAPGAPGSIADILPCAELMQHRA